jgi:glycosyltransferase involved in cell wall biosynthesis
MPLGFDPDLFHPHSSEQIAATRRRLGLHSTTIAYFGRLTPEKGLDTLLQALAATIDLQWQLLLDRFSHYQSAYQARIQSQITALGLTDRVVFFDATHREIPDYMNAADIVVLPSISTPTWREQYGRVIPEAMACGKIVVGSSSGAIPEVIGDSGFVFPEGDVRALAALLRSLLTATDDELKVMRRKAEHRAHTELSIVRQAEILYGKLSQSESGVSPN